MKADKIFIVGIVASGKTTLARRLSEGTGIAWHELDDIVHRRLPTDAAGSKRTPEEQREAIGRIDREGSWIFEGTDRASYSYLYGMADLVIFLDPPLWKRRIRIMTRFLKQKTGREASRYTPDLAMLRSMFRWTNEFERNRPKFEAELERYGNKVLRVTESRDAEKMLGV
ncbi:P-loop NTPase family protein [Saccharibacillus alkalitolerans]|uniref:DNA topology modulation protein FlaR n=1 Tax=Saccharibacillus alkalitolerans TaxID=2705290 RepID=A0ABX0FCE6_9BACL|nr:hypothetical protein [Saccharibacillus alkalitolerans]NGZ77685.1 hypothetical protein [Saccharibacillus alkalitolerans]